jgi:SAM-dependent MidA family methyltransferase
VEAIRDEILRAPGQRITFARFMERALTEPELGYYASSELRPTRSGDFLTAPELHPFFGRCLARFVAAAWREAGSPSRYVVCEHGAGRGTLRASCLEGLRVDGSPLAEVISWVTVDLPGRTVDLPGRTEASAETVDLVLANEYLDALPVHRLIQAGGLHEAWVGWRHGWFVEIFGEVSAPQLEASLAAEGIELREGQRADISLAAPAWLLAQADTLREGGLLLVIDYGHEAAELYGPRRMAGTLLTYRGHVASEDPYRAVGQADITAHVDLSALRRTAREAGLEESGRTTQARFLADLGLGDLLAELGRDPATGAADYLLARSAVARFLDPRHLGAFAVLAWRRPSKVGVRVGRSAMVGSTAAVLPGFASPI